MNILRFITAGSVDDGKSTLIGRLLYDSKSILTDQLEQLEKQSKSRNEDGIDLALLTDGLRAEREQGITIDVAYRYFATPRRKFIIADAPGHVQYTRNMITGASNADLIIILIDARQGVVEQTRRHSIIASLLRIPHVVVAINKMDLVDFSQDVFNNIVIDYSAVANQLGLHQVSYFPISALQGDNIVDPSTQMSWYDGPSLLQYLEELPLENDQNHVLPRFQVQYVIRPQTPDLHDYRGYAGRITSGIYRKGQEVTVLPSGLKSRISSIEVGGASVEEAFAPQSVVIQLEDDLDISRGDTLVTGELLPEVKNESEALLCWMDEKPLQPGNKYILQHQSRQVRAMIRNLHSKVDVNTLQDVVLDGPVSLNEIVKVTVRTSAPLATDRYADLRRNGSAILVDETSNNTVAALLFT